MQTYDKALNDASKLGNKTKQKIKLKLICGADVLKSMLKPGLWDDKHVLITIKLTYKITK